MSETALNASASSSKPTTVEDAVDNARRAFALKKYESAVDFYATALEIATEQSGDNAPENADLYFAYGQALLENAISQASVLGKDQPEEKPEEDENQASTSSTTNGPILSFSGDAEDVEDETTSGDPAIDLFASAEQAVADADASEEQEEEEDEEADEPEDDFNAAWEVFEMARNLYAKQAESSSDIATKLKLADTYIALGDVSLETEKFDQAILDYQESLRLKSDILPLSSRQIAEAHYKLSIVLDLTSGRLAEAIDHAQRALKSVDGRLNELEKALPSASDVAANDSQSELADSVKKLSKSQIEGELKELNGLREDLALKVEELKTSPNDAIAGNASELAAAALDKALGTGGSSSSAKVNDLTAVVKKKKKQPVEEPVEPSASGSKRKADDEPSEDTADKKIKLSP